MATDMVSAEEILLEGPRAPGSKADESKMAGDDLVAVLLCCRTCRKIGDHWSSQCPYKYKDLAPPTENLVDKPSASKTGLKVGSLSRPSKLGLKVGYVSRSTRPRPENSVRVTNLSEDTRDPDLLELFSTVGPVFRHCVIRESPSGVSMGCGYVNFVNEEDAERAINMFNGYAYGSVILRVEWARPRAT